MDTINDIITQIKGLSPELLVGAVVIIIGYVLRSVKKFPNEAIPLCCVLLGAVVYPLLVPIPAGVKGAAVHAVMLGLLIGFLAWIAHDKLISKIEDKIPWLSGFLTHNDPPPAQPPTPPTPPAK